MPIAELVRDSRGLEKLVLSHPSGARAEAYLHGAHVTSWRTPGGAERLFLSSASRFAAGVAIRGGVPVIFPQFADRGPLPKHGFARVSPWRFLGEGDADDGASRASFALEDDTSTRELWPHPFAARVDVALGERSLAIALSVTNRGHSPFDFTAALHSYLRVADAAHATVHGLLGCMYESRAEGVASAVEERDEVRLDGEVDRVYVDVSGPVVVRDSETGVSIEARGEGFPDVVLWNPGAEQGRELHDLGAGEHRTMLCVEAAVVRAPVRLAPGSSWMGQQTLTAAE